MNKRMTMISAHDKINKKEGTRGYMSRQMKMTDRHKSTISKIRSKIKRKIKKEYSKDEQTIEDDRQAKQVMADGRPLSATDQGPGTRGMSNSYPGGTRFESNLVPADR
jgi:hypothetical protein